jgi:SPOR domain
LRAIFLTLLLANLVFLAWANLIDVKPPPPDDALGNLPRLELLSEVREQPARGLPPHEVTPADARDPAATAAPTATKIAAPVDGATPSTDGGAQTEVATPGEVATPARAIDHGNAAGPGSGPGSRTAAPAPGAAAVAAPGTAGRRTTGRVVLPGLEQARAQARGRGQGGQGYWVFIGGLESPSQAGSVLRRLERNGISDAKIMRASDTRGARVSVGLFTKRADAERRASAVRRAGLDAEIDVLQRGVTDRVASAASGGRGGGAAAPL